MRDAPLALDTSADPPIHEVVPRLLDAKVLADLIGISERTFALWVHQGWFPQPTIRLRRYAKWEARDYVAWVAEQRRLTMQPASRRRQIIIDR